LAKAIVKFEVLTSGAFLTQPEMALLATKLKTIGFLSNIFWLFLCHLFRQHPLHFSWLSRLLLFFVSPHLFQGMQFSLLHLQDFIDTERFHLSPPSWYRSWGESYVDVVGNRCDYCLGCLC
jgi:hypothetical protein